VQFLLHEVVAFLRWYGQAASKPPNSPADLPGCFGVKRKGPSFLENSAGSGSGAVPPASSEVEFESELEPEAEEEEEEEEEEEDLEPDLAGASSTGGCGGCS
jgi:hypothetical protein